MKNSIKILIGVVLLATLSNCRDKEVAPAVSLEIAGDGLIIKGGESVAWTDIFVQDPAKSDVVVKGAVTVNGTLTIGPGTRVEISSNAGIVIGATGTLIMDGSAITLTGTTDAWSGVVVQNGGRVTINGATIEEAGVGEGAGVVVESGGGGTINNTTVTNGGGIELRDGAKITSFKANKISKTRGYPLTVALGLLAQIDATNTFGADNKYNYIRLTGSTVSSDITFSETGPKGVSETYSVTGFSLPYLVSSSLTVSNAKLTITPKTEVQFGSNAGITFAGSGRIDASQCTLKGQNGTWGGIVLVGGDNVLNTVTIENAGVVVNGAAANLSARSCIFQNAPGYALDVRDAATLTLEGGVFQNNGGALPPIRLPFKLINSLTANTKFTGNKTNLVEITAPASVVSAGVFNIVNIGIPYWVKGSIQLSGTAQLNMAAGSQLQFDPTSVSATAEQLMIAGTALINAVGTAAAPITITASSGNWSGLFVRSTNAANLLDNVRLERGGRLIPTPTAMANRAGLGAKVGCNLFVDFFSPPAGGLQGSLFAASLLVKNTILSAGSGYGLIAPSIWYDSRFFVQKSNNNDIRGNVADVLTYF